MQDLFLLKFSNACLCIVQGELEFLDIEVFAIWSEFHCV